MGSYIKGLPGLSRWMRPREVCKLPLPSGVALDLQAQIKVRAGSLSWVHSRVVDALVKGNVSGVLELSLSVFD